MRTTIDLDDDLLQRAMRVARARTKTELLERGLQALIDVEARRIAIEQAGTLPEIELPPRRGGAPDLDPALPVTRHPRR
jgi:Arc/MetJ family transcription regulator